VATQTCMTLIHLRRAVPCLGTSLGPGFLAHTVDRGGNSKRHGSKRRGVHGYGIDVIDVIGIHTGAR
jgi:hypothetical protein